MIFFKLLLYIFVQTSSLLIFVLFLLLLQIAIDVIPSDKVSLMLNAIILIGGLLFFVPIGSAIYVYKKNRELILKGYDTLLPSFIWSGLCLFFWYPGLSIYLFVKKYKFSAPPSPANPVL